MYPVRDVTVKNPLVAFVRPACPYCQALQKLFAQQGKSPTYINIERLSPAEVAHIKRASGSSTWPQVWYQRAFVGGYTESAAYPWKEI
jgi:glutaredoxin